MKDQRLSERQLAAVSRSGRAFTPAYRPAPPSFWGQLWAALTRSTPAFTGAELPNFGQTATKPTHTLPQEIRTNILLPMFRSKADRAEVLADNQGYVLALTLAHERELGIRFARQIVQEDIAYLARDLSVYRETGLQRFYQDYCRAIASALSIALTLDSLLARDLRREKARERAHKRRIMLSHARSWVRGRVLLLNYRYSKRATARSIIWSSPHFASEFVTNILLRVLDMVRLPPVTVASRRIRDRALAFNKALHRLREMEYDLGLDEAELATGLRQVLPGIDLRNANLSNAQLAGADLRNSKLQAAKLSGANLSSAFLEGASLEMAMMQGTDLTGAVLVDADLSYADLTAADLSGSNMTSANLQGVIWSELTAWPASVSKRIRENSRLIRPGVYQVDEGGQQVPSQHVVTA
jgi:Pentapeptide repeats (8 copies)